MAGGAEMPFSTLKTIGFTEDDIKVYELLVRLGEAQRSDLMAKAKVPKANFDGAINHLLSYGAIEESGTKVCAAHPKIFLQKYYIVKETDSELRLADLKNKVEELKRLLEPIYSEKRLGVRLDEIWRDIDGLPAMELETVKMVSLAREEVCILAEQFSWFNKVREELITVLGRNVKVRVLLLLDNRDVRGRVEEMRQMGIEVRHATCNWRHTRYTIVDTKEMVFLIWAQKSKNSRIYFRPGYTENPGMVSVFRDSFELLWEKAEQFK